MPIQVALFKMECHGFAVDQKVEVDLLNTCKELQEQLKREIFSIYGTSFDLDSTRKVSEVLGLKNPNSKAIPSTSKKVLAKLNLPIANYIIQYRSLGVAIQKTVMPLMAKNFNSQRIFGRSDSFTKTGRITMYEPSLQNVPKNFEISLPQRKETINCRSIFRISGDRCLLVADFCHLELRILTHFAKDPHLIDIMQSDRDVFRLIAAKWYKKSESVISEKERHDAKQLCYGIIYGMGKRAVAEAMDTEEDEAEILMAEFHATFPCIK